MASCAPAAESFCAIDHAMLRLFATPNTTAVRPLRSIMTDIVASLRAAGCDLVRRADRRLESRRNNKQRTTVVTRLTDFGVRRRVSRLTIATSLSEMDRLRPAWEEMQAGCSTFFQRFAWNRLAAELLGESPHVVVAETSGGRAIVPAALTS